MASDFNFFLADETVAASQSAHVINIDDRCSKIWLTPLYDASWVVADGTTSLQLNNTANTPAVEVLAPMILDNVDGQITSLIITTVADCVLNVKQEGGWSGIDRRNV